MKRKSLAAFALLLFLAGCSNPTNQIVEPPKNRFPEVTLHEGSDSDSTFTQFQTVRLPDETLRIEVIFWIAEGCSLVPDGLQQSTSLNFAPLIFCSQDDGTFPKYRQTIFYIMSNAEEDHLTQIQFNHRPNLSINKL